MSDTPKTDDLKERMKCWNKSEAYWDMLNFARGLERELNIVSKGRAGLLGQIQNLERKNAELLMLASGLDDEIARLQIERTRVTDEMVNRFLCWRLPATFNPDGGVKFTPLGDPKSHFWPVGTNLFSADEAREMLTHIISRPSHLV